MELGEDSRFAARVHLHAYIGFLQKDGGTAGMRSVKVRKSDLMFCGSTPFVVATRGRHGKRSHEAVAQGMYYVAGPKSTCMLRFTDLEPIEEVKFSDKVIETRYFLREGQGRANCILVILLCCQRINLRDIMARFGCNRSCLRSSFPVLCSLTVFL